ncbi:hypothetical protein P8C59_005020 [Phyllachora maydis]|uniref:Uncharacterized protein n=1 Tax=Phyllachora maydis TaxID=1825666 RepID=A0AAD9I4U5_9PEZI|nr:hypothetical protein P8C59_005020 [Phyllachora maydis]
MTSGSRYSVVEFCGEELDLSRSTVSHGFADSSYSVCPVPPTVLHRARENLGVNSVSSDLQQSMKKPEDGGVRREIEDVDRGYGDPKSPAPCQYDYWQSPWQNIRNQIQSELAQTGASHEEPTLYKILAYDPTMQTVNVAETTSVVPDSATPLPPAEVLLRLSNPTKFFPHFGPLQAQGFEIVSGSGDVLVFRKVRPATAEADATEEGMSSPGAGSAAAKPSVTSAFRKHVNPIDMMGFEPLEYGGTAASRFASPTGFVNYDLPPAPEPARFASGINVRREEDVFSGAKDTRQQDQGKARKSLPRRLAISAAWVGGVSYALGVVSEYFKTGGSDGKGPKGF